MLMGESLSWLALENTDAVSAAKLLGLQGSEVHAAPGEGALVGSALPSGWYLLVAKGSDHPLVSDRVLRECSLGRRAVAVSLEEHVMISAAALWSAGELKWRVSHDAQEDIRDLQIEGERPAELSALHAKAEAELDAEADDPDVDYFFEVPLLLADQLVGYKHDELMPAELESAFVALHWSAVSASPLSRRPWWQFW